MDKRTTVYLCARSLFNISKDLLEIDKTASNSCLAIAKSIIDNNDGETPTANIHGDNMVHDSNIAEEVEEMVKKIQDENI